MQALDILVTTSYYAPEVSGSAPYLTQLAEHLGARGHRVVVATTFAHYPAWQSSADGKLALTEHRNGVRVRRRWTYVPSRQSAMHRALYETTLFVSGLTALPLRSRPDVVIGTCPTLAGGALAATAAALYRIPYGLVFQDLTGPAARQSGVAGGEKVASAARRAELVLARRAERIAIIAEGFRAYLEEGGVDPARIERLRNWTLGAEPVEEPEATRRRLGWSQDDFVCLHGGNMGHKQHLEDLLEAAVLLQADGVRVVLAGDGNERPGLVARARDLGLANVDFLEPQKPGQWEAMMRAADVLLVNQRASVSDMSLPSKLTAYFAAGRPVIAAVSSGSETAREIEAAQAGLVVTPGDPAALRDAVTAFRHDAAKARIAGSSAQTFAATHLSAENVLAGYERFVRTVASARAPRAPRKRRARWKASSGAGCN